MGDYMSDIDVLKDLLKRSIDIIHAMNSSNSCKICGWYKKPMSPAHRKDCPLPQFWEDACRVLEEWD